MMHYLHSLSTFTILIHYGECINTWRTLMRALIQSGTFVVRGRSSLGSSKPRIGLASAFNHLSWEHHKNQKNQFKLPKSLTNSNWWIFSSSYRRNSFLRAFLTLNSRAKNITTIIWILGKISDSQIRTDNLSLFIIHLFIWMKFISSNVLGFWEFFNWSVVDDWWKLNFRSLKVQRILYSRILNLFCSFFCNSLGTKISWS